MSNISGLAELKRLGSGEFFGQTLRRARYGDVVLTETFWAGRCTIPAHVHDNALLLPGRQRRLRRNPRRGRPAGAASPDTSFSILPAHHTAIDSARTAAA
jgi:hypothetical protein